MFNDSTPQDFHQAAKDDWLTVSFPLCLHYSHRSEDFTEDAEDLRASETVRQCSHR